jgi:NADPH-dependent 2,4-dienoyl-CoA reductase/sulfur reductase-like enzyme
MKAAAVAAERGHNVTLFEKERRLGGQVLLAEQLPGRAEFGGAATNLISEIERYGVELRTGTEVDRSTVDELAPDVLIVATGATPYHPDIELMGEAMPIHSAWEIIQGASIPSGRVVVADWRCDWIGMGVAQMLAELGHHVILGVGGYMAGQRLQMYVRHEMLAALHRSHVEIIPTVRLFGADGTSVYMENTLSRQAVVLDDISALVLSQGHTANDTLLDALDGFEGEVHAIGDCLAPRTVEEAVLEGLQVASGI